MSLPHFLLGLLSYGSLSGYDLNKIAQASIQAFWTNDQSQIYRALYKMEEDAWVSTETVVQSGSPNKKIYHVTDAGRQELNTWLGVLHDTSSNRLTWVGQVFFSDLLPSPEFTTLLQARVKVMQDYLAFLQTTRDQYYPKVEWQTLPTEQRGRWLALDYGIQMIGTEIQWLQSTIQRIQEA